MTSDESQSASTYTETTEYDTASSSNRAALAARTKIVSHRSKESSSQEARAFQEVPLHPVPRRISRLGQALIRLSREELGIVEVENDAIVSEQTVQSHSVEASQTDVATKRDESVQERRAFPRRESICFAAIYEQQDEASVNQQEVRWLLHSSALKGAIADVSMNGIAFLLPKAIEPGTSLLIRLINRRLDRHFDTAGRVIGSRQDGLGEWKIVCRFERNLTLDQVHEYGQNVFASERV